MSILYGEPTEEDRRFSASWKVGFKEAERRRLETREPELKYLVTKNGLIDLTPKYRRPSMEGLMLHCGSEKMTREELRGIPTPQPTQTWKPVPHFEAATLVAHVAENRGYEIMSEDYGLNQSGTRMFGVLKFAPEGHPEYTRALGIRNSHDKSFALGLVVGVSICCCDNMAFSYAGEGTTIHRKHTSGIELETLIPKAFDSLGEQYIRLERNIDRLKLEMISIDEARIVTVMAAEVRAIPSCDILAVLDGFREPEHEQFREPTRWSLYNSFTETAKKYSPARADQCYQRLAKMFGLV